MNDFFELCAVLLYKQNKKETVKINLRWRQEETILIYVLALFLCVDV